MDGWTDASVGHDGMMDEEQKASDSSSQDSNPQHSAEMSLSRFLSQSAKAREPSPIRALMPLLKLPGMISLGGGLPNAHTFPFDSFEFGLKSGERIKFSPEAVQEALQYGPTPGHPELLKHLRDLQLRTHRPKYEDWDIAVTTGSQEGFCRAFDAVLDPGDSLLVENPSYPGALAFLKTHGVNLMPVETDEHGLIPESMVEVLMAAKKNFETDPSTAPPPPKVLYTIPTGQNPSGATLSPARREQLLQIAKEWDLLVLEDDPYFFLHYGRTNDLETDPEILQRKPLEPPPDSLFSMDSEGRVIRFDSFSKILSSGLRIGFVSAHKVLLEPMLFQGQGEFQLIYPLLPKPSDHHHLLPSRLPSAVPVTNLHSSGLSQLVVSELLKNWGAEGWEKHVEEVGQFYLHRRNLFFKAAEKHLTGLAEWGIPSAGMFGWFNLKGVEDSDPLIKEKAAEARVLMIPGQSCNPLGEKSAFCRASFSTASEEDMNQALERFATVLRENKK